MKVKFCLACALFAVLVLSGFAFALRASQPVLEESLARASGETTALLIPSEGIHLNDLIEITSASNAVLVNKFAYGEIVEVRGTPDALQKIADSGKAKRVAAERSYKLFLNESIPLVNATYAWNPLGYTGSGVKIAILDTGINASHPMLAGRIVLARDFTNDNTTSDLNGHGTHVAGIAAGSNSSGGVYNGVAPQASLYNAKVLNANGEGDSSTLIAGINWAIDPDGNPNTDDGAKVISMSLGATDGSYDEVVAAALDAAIAKGVIVVAASGNCGPCGSCSFNGVTFPGSYEKAITVGAVDKQKFLACFTGMGSLNGYAGKPELLAPGVSVFSSAPNGYAAFSGTSMSTPFVAGTVALLSQAFPSLTQAQAKQILQDNGEHIGVTNGNGEATFLNVGNSFTSAADYLHSAIVSETPKRPLIGRPMTITVTTVSVLNSLSGNVTLPDLSVQPLSFSKVDDFTWNASFTPVFAGDYVARASALGKESSSAFTAGIHSLDYPNSVFELLPTIFASGYYNNGQSTQSALITSEFKDGFGNTVDFESSNTTDVPQNGDLVSFFNVSFNSSGLYSVNSTLYLNGVVAETLSQDFNVTVQPSLETTSIQVPDVLVKGEERNFTAMVNNTGQTPLNATLEVILVKDGQEVGFYYSTETEIAPGMEANITAPVVANFSSGGYLVKTNVHYGGIKTSSTTSVSVIAPDLGGLSSMQTPQNLELGGNYSVNASFTSRANATLDVLVKARLLKRGIPVEDFTSVLSAVETNETRSFEIPVSFATAGAMELQLTSLFEGNSETNSTPVVARDYSPPVFLNASSTGSVINNGPVEFSTRMQDDSSIASAQAVVNGVGTFNMSVSQTSFSEALASGVLSQLLAPGPYSFHFHACDEFNQCSDSQQLSFNVVLCNGRKVLVVEDGSSGFFDSINGTLCVAKLSPESGLQSQDLLSRFNAVIYSNDGFALSDNDAALLVDYSSNRRGGLLLVGSGIVSRISNTTLASLAGISPSLSSINSSALSGISFEGYHPATAFIGNTSFNSSACNPQAMALTNATPLAEWNDGSIAAAASVSAKVLLASFCPHGLQQEALASFAKKSSAWLVFDNGGDLNITQISHSYAINNTPFQVNASLGVPQGNFSYSAFVGSQKVYSANSSSDKVSFNLTLPYGEYPLKLVVNDDFSAQELDYYNDSKTIGLFVAPTQADLAVGYAGLRKTTGSSNSSNGSGGGGFNLINISIISVINILSSKLSALNVTVVNNGGTASNATLFLKKGGQVLGSKNFTIQPGKTTQQTFFANLTPGRNDLEASVSNQNDFNYSDNSLNATVFNCVKPGKVLVVNDSDTESGEASQSGALFFDSLRNLGYCADSWDEASDGQVYAANLSAYSFVVWSAGSHEGTALGEEDLNALSNYSGPVLLEGADIGFDHQNDSTLSHFNVSFAGDLDLNGSGVALQLLNHQVFAGIQSMVLNGSVSRYPDKMQPAGLQGIARWPDGNYSILASSPAMTLLYFAFSMDSVQDNATRNLLLQNAFNWLYGNGSFPPLPPNLVSPQDGFLTNSSIVTLEYNSSESGSRNISFFVYGVENQTPLLLYYGNSTSFGWNGLSEGTHSWFAIATDGRQNSTLSEARSFVTDYTPPQSLSFGVNSTTAHSEALFYSNWTDASNLSGFVFSWDNGTGTMQNGSWMPLTGANATAAAVEILPEANSSVSWVFYANDSAGNWNSTGLMEFTTENRRWWNESFGYKLVSNYTAVSTAALENFVIPVNYSSLQKVSAGKMRSTGWDSTFTNGTEDAQLNCELEKGTNNSANQVHWVQMPYAYPETAQNAFANYYGSNSTTAPQCDNAYSIWSGYNYTAVLHGTDGQNANAKDSTRAGRNFTNRGGVTSAAGYFGSAWNFSNAANSGLNSGAACSEFFQNSNIEIDLMIKKTGPWTGVNNPIIADGLGWFNFNVGNATHLYWITGAHTCALDKDWTLDGSWHAVSLRMMSNGTVDAWIDGVKACATTNTPIGSLSGTCYIGGQGDNLGGVMHGDNYALSEIRLANQSQSDDYVRQLHNSWLNGTNIATASEMR